ncbi:trypsin-2-like [Schistocerca nitens]|uniref:trypsin-2-like n=1 Tax=Schistocerca nitens TaxID=7011 RepID=UPI0021192491|nr:trypsin-2-like [Schistocerca nitens]
MACFHVTVLCLLLAVQLHLVASRALRMRSRIHDRIIGGSEASIEDFPWTLALLYTDSHQCGASIIGNQWALTAAHCIGQRSSLYTLRAGSSNRDSGGTLMDVVEIYEHELHDSNSGDYDIALMQTAGSFPLGINVSIVNLPEAGYDPAVGLALTVRGWGCTETDYPLILHKVDIRVSGRSE